MHIDYQLPGGPMTERQREEASNYYLLTLMTVMVGLPFPIINLIACLLYFFNTRSKSAFVKFHAFQAITSQIPIIIMNSISLFWTIHIIFYDYLFTNLYVGYIITVIIFNLVDYFYNIVAAIKARRGQLYMFTFFGTLSYMIYKNKLHDDTKITA